MIFMNILKMKMLEIILVNYLMEKLKNKIENILTQIIS